MPVVIPETLCALALGLGFEVCRALDPARLGPEERIRALCVEDRCGRYDRHHLCPPRIGTLEQARARLARYARGLILQWGRALDVDGDHERVVRSMVEFHLRVLDLEQAAAVAGAGEPWGLIGGCCALCRPCTAEQGQPCPEPQRARPSLEALGIDLLGLLDAMGLDSRFRDDRVTWTGCLLYDPLPHAAPSNSRTA